MAARIVIAFSVLLAPALSHGDVPPSESGTRATDSMKEQGLLEKGKPVERALALGEVHTYALKLDAGRTVTVLLEKHGVAAVATPFAPDGNKAGILDNRGTEQIVFLAESAGDYRIAVRTFFRPSPPGHYLINLVDVHATTDQEKSELARQSCKEKSWLDSENHFLVNAALESISQCMAAVGHRLKGNHPQAAELATASEAEVRYLISRWQWGEFVSPAYQESLTDYFKELASSAAEPNAKLAFATMKEVVAGLKVKADHCRMSNRGLGKDVRVKAIARKESGVVDGFAIYYKTCLHKYPKSNTPLRFPGVSTAFHTLEADRYIFWAGKFGQPPPPQPEFMCTDVKGNEDPQPIDVPAF